MVRSLTDFPIRLPLDSYAILEARCTAEGVRMAKGERDYLAYLLRL
jgi:hypothetical protein